MSSSPPVAAAGDDVDDGRCFPGCCCSTKWTSPAVILPPALKKGTRIQASCRTGLDVDVDSGDDGSSSDVGGEKGDGSVMFAVKSVVVKGE